MGEKPFYRPLQLLTLSPWPRRCFFLTLLSIGCLMVFEKIGQIAHRRMSTSEATEERKQPQLLRLPGEPCAVSDATPQELGEPVATDKVKVKAERYTTPTCKPHVTTCGETCTKVGNYVREERNNHLTNTNSGWFYYYPSVQQYYRCAGAKKIVEVGAAYGSQTAYHLQHGDDYIEEYHIVDPFMAGYDKSDLMSHSFYSAAPDATPEDISIAWYESMSKDLGVDGLYADSGMKPAGCKLRIHRMKSEDGAELFGDHSVDAVFIDGLHTYDGVKVDIAAWVSKIRVGGSLIFNDYHYVQAFPGIAKAVKEEAELQNIEIVMLDSTNALLGGKKECAKGPPPPH